MKTLNIRMVDLCAHMCVFIYVCAEELVKESGNNEIVVRKLDLSSLASVREFAKQINREESRLDVLIHNAGTAETFSKKLSPDGIELTMATNHYGPFLLTHLLIGQSICQINSHQYSLPFAIAKLCAAPCTCLYKTINHPILIFQVTLVKLFYPNTDIHILTV